MRTYSITDAVRLLGVSISTVSRRLPADRASRGRSARLSLEELDGIAAAIHVDAASVRQRAALAERFGPDLAPDAAAWVLVASERGLPAALEAHRARIPEGLLAESGEQGIVELPRPWGPRDGWAAVKSPEALNALLPPLDR